MQDIVPTGKIITVVLLSHKKLLRVLFENVLLLFLRPVSATQGIFVEGLVILQLIALSMPHRFAWSKSYS